MAPCASIGVRLSHLRAARSLATASPQDKRRQLICQLVGHPRGSRMAAQILHLPRGQPSLAPPARAGI